VNKLVWPALVLCAASYGLVRAQTSTGSFVVTNVRVFDGERVHEQAAVAVMDGIIQAVGRDVRPWRHLPTIDGRGATLLPGFIDTHVHVQSREDLRDALQFGVTTVLDMGATIEPRELFGLRADADRTNSLADLRSAGLLARTPRDNAKPDPRIRVQIPGVRSVDDVRRFVQERTTEGSDYLKLALTGVRSRDPLVPNLQPPLVRALVATAHENRLLAVAHVETIEDVHVALDAGVDRLAHAWRTGGFDAATARRVAGAGVFVSTTLSIPDGFTGEGQAALLADRRVHTRLTPSARAHLQRGGSRPAGSGASDPATSLRDQIAAVRSLHQAGARLLTGTDAHHDNPSAFGIAVHRELELLVRAGLTPLQVLRAATADAADAFRLQDRGRVRARARADLLLVRGNPLTDITATRDILRVWKRGVEP
jgi:imidazolonepropionase-like amidohydrolase